MDAALITETWLNNSAEDQAWLKASALPKNGWCCSHSNRESLARSRGLMLVYKDNIEVKSLNKGMYDTFKYASWQLNSGHKTITIVGIYILKFL